MNVSKLIIFYSFVIFKTPIDNSSWSAEDVLRSCPEMSDQKSGCLIINIKPNRDATIWYAMNKCHLDIAYNNDDTTYENIISSYFLELVQLQVQ